MHTKWRESAHKIQTKCRKSAEKVQTKCKQSASKMQTKCTQSAEKLQTIWEQTHECTCIILKNSGVISRYDLFTLKKISQEITLSKVIFKSHPHEIVLENYPLKVTLKKASSRSYHWENIFEKIFSINSPFDKLL